MRMTADVCMNDFDCEVTVTQKPLVAVVGSVLEALLRLAAAQQRSNALLSFQVFLGQTR